MNKYNSQDKFIKSLIQAKKNIEDNKIGTLQEKMLHRCVKRYCEEDESFHEIKIGSYYVDIFKNNKVIEIQTKQFGKMYKKLEHLLKDYHVEIVFPTFYNKWLIWINPETKVKSNRRLSPKRGSMYQVFKELYRIKSLLVNPNLHLRILLIDIDEYRLLNGYSKDKKRGSVCFERIPLELIEEIYIAIINDYNIFIPSDLKHEFTSKDYAKATKLTIRDSQVALNILYSIGIVERIGKIKRQYIYQLKE